MSWMNHGLWSLPLRRNRDPLRSPVHLWRKWVRTGRWYPNRSSKKSSRPLKYKRFNRERRRRNVNPLQLYLLAGPLLQLSRLRFWQALGNQPRPRRSPALANPRVRKTLIVRRAAMDGAYPMRWRGLQQLTGCYLLEVFLPMSCGLQTSLLLCHDGTVKIVRSRTVRDNGARLHRCQPGLAP